jgi:hypothetical protein
MNGHVEILKWARANGCPWDWWLRTWAKEKGHDDILEWAKANGLPGSHGSTPWMPPGYSA